MEKEAVPVLKERPRRRTRREVGSRRENVGESAGEMRTGENGGKEMSTENNENQGIKNERSQYKEESTEGNEGEPETCSGEDREREMSSNRREAGRLVGEESMPPLLSTCRAEDNKEVMPLQEAEAGKTEESKAQIPSLEMAERTEEKSDVSSCQAVNKTGEEKAYISPILAANKTEKSKTDMPFQSPADSMTEEKAQVPPLVPPNSTTKIESLPSTSNKSLMVKVMGGVNATSKLGVLPSVVPFSTNSVPALRPSSTSQTNASHMRLVQTADGRKILLTNVVSVPKVMPNKPVILLSKGQGVAGPNLNTALVTASAPRVTPVVSANMPQTIVLNPTQPQVPQPVVLKIPGISQPILMQQQHTNPKGAKSQSTAAPKTTTATTWKPTPASTTTTAAVPGPITSPAKAVLPGGPIMFVQNGATKFKVVGKPVPVKLFPKVQKIAPKNITTTTATPVASPVTFSSLKSVRKASSLVPPLSQVPPGPSKAPLPEPPAYLNIKVKEEPAEEGSAADVGATIKTEPVEAEEEDDGMGEGPDIPLQMDAMLDVRIKEEATDEQSKCYSAE